jgi:hypothetical protein
VRRAPLVALLFAGAASAYIPAVGSLFKRAAAHADGIDRSRAVTLRGSVQVGEAVKQASLTLQFPLRCRLQITDAKSPGAVSARGDGARQRVEDEGAPLGDARELLQLACPLLTFKGGGRNSDRALASSAIAAGARLDQSTLGRLEGRVVYVIGAGPRQLDVPQIWLYKDELTPARLLSQREGGLSDLRLLEYGSPAAAQAFPRVIELWKAGKLAARFEALEPVSRKSRRSDEEEDRD